MLVRSSRNKRLTIGLMIVATTLLHYSTELEAHHFHVFYQGLYFIPVLLAGLWFGLRGGLVASLSITVLYLPFTVMHWKAYSPDDFNNLMEMVLYNLVAVIVGILRDRENREQVHLREAESLAAIGKAVSTIAHELKNPLVAMGGFSRLVKEHLPEDHAYRDKIDIVIKEGRRLEKLVGEILDFSRPPNLRRANADLSTAGIISAQGRSLAGLAEFEDFIQTDASINPGNSGGALADLQGRVIGINTAISSPTGGSIGIGFAIPINKARQIMKALITEDNSGRR